MLLRSSANVLDSPYSSSRLRTPHQPYGEPMPPASVSTTPLNKRLPQGSKVEHEQQIADRAKLSVAEDRADRLPNRRTATPKQKTSTEPRLAPTAPSRPRSIQRVVSAVGGNPRPSTRYAR